jgi:hypothetical protein
LLLCVALLNPASIALRPASQGWELDGVERLLEPRYYTKGESIGAGYFYAMHLFESHANFQKYINK